jgi:hypothetical protein
MKILTKNLDQLPKKVIDWLVAQCEGVETYDVRDFENQRNHTVKHGEYVYRWSMSWAQGGEVIERAGIAIERGGDGWQAAKTMFDAKSVRFNARTPLVAAMICFIATTLGDEVEVPDELLA